MKPQILYSAQQGGGDPFNLIQKTIPLYNPTNISAEGVLLLHGGADIATSIYGQKCNKHCYANSLSYRDEIELAMIEQARKYEIPIIGICRGAQMLCAVDGGYLVQHIEGHNRGDHTIIDTRTFDMYNGNSCHHQMMQPKDGHKNMVLAETGAPTTGYTEDDQEVIYPSCPEIVYFPRLNAIGIQGHPEWMVGSKFTKFCASLINEFLYKE